MVYRFKAGMSALRMNLITIHALVGTLWKYHWPGGHDLDTGVSIPALTCNI